MVAMRSLTATARALLLLLATAMLLVTLAAPAQAAPGDTTRVSVDSSGNQANNSSGVFDISADGRYVSFPSNASNLVAGDTNGAQDIFLHDRQTGSTELVNVNGSGEQLNGLSQGQDISADGRYVSFASKASNAVANDTSAADTYDIFVRDRQNGTTERVSVDSSGNQANGTSQSATISADGRYVSFGSDAANLVANNANSRIQDVFMHDRQTGATELVSVNSSGAQSNSGSAFSSMSADGRYVAFGSNGSNLVANDTNNAYDIFVHERAGSDTAAPDTSIDGGPSGTVGATSASFTFSSTEAGSTFECSLDGAAFSDCSSPKSYAGLSDGQHTFEVKATDSAGNTDGTPAIRRWSVDTTPVDTTAPTGTVNIDAGATYATSRSVTLSLSATDPAPASGMGSMRFMNDGGSWSAWEPYARTKEWTLKNVQGARTVSVQYRDKAGNVSRKAADTIKLDTVHPRVTVTSPVDHAEGVSPTANVKATFSEAMNPATITETSIILRRDFGQNRYQAVPATVTYYASSETAVLNPSSNLVRGATYVATVFQSNEDLAGNALDQYPGLEGDNGLFWRFRIKN
jgi:hypothetical protein